MPIKYSTRLPLWIRFVLHSLDYIKTKLVPDPLPFAPRGPPHTLLCAPPSRHCCEALSEPPINKLSLTSATLWQSILYACAYLATLPRLVLHDTVIIINIVHFLGFMQTSVLRLDSSEHVQSVAACLAHTCYQLCSAARAS